MSNTELNENTNADRVTVASDGSDMSNETYRRMLMEFVDLCEAMRRGWNGYHRLPDGEGKKRLGKQMNAMAAYRIAYHMHH